MRAAPMLEIGEVSPDVPPPSRIKNPLERTLNALPVGSSVPIMGADTDTIRALVAAYRRARMLPKGSFTVAQDDEGAVRVWRRA
jgi:hypothetical protein